MRVLLFIDERRCFGEPKLLPVAGIMNLEGLHDLFFHTYLPDLTCAGLDLGVLSIRQYNVILSNGTTVKIEKGDAQRWAAVICFLKGLENQSEGILRGKVEVLF